MAALLLSLCCFVGCPLLMGVMWLMNRDREGLRLEREVRRLNAQADSRRAPVAPPPPISEPLPRAERPAVGAAAEPVRR